MKYKMYEITDGDYYASHNLHLMIPGGMDLVDEERDYRIHRGKQTGLDNLKRWYDSFEEWLLMRGAKPVTEELLGEYGES